MKKISEFNTKILSSDVGKFGLFRATFLNDKLSKIEYISNQPDDDANVFKSIDPNFYKAIYTGLQDLMNMVKPSPDPNSAPDLDTTKSTT
jgi:hypothetical protein